MTYSKHCFKCGFEKTISEFYKHPQMADGHVNKCKECNKIDNQKNRLLKIDYYHAYDNARAKLPHRVENSLRVSSAWRASDRRIMHCHNAVCRAIAKGILVPKPCQMCGKPYDHAHHDDYNQPLNVMWLCVQHHHARHAFLEVTNQDPFDAPLTYPLSGE